MNKRLVSFLSMSMIAFNSFAQAPTIVKKDSYPVYIGNDLGCTYSKLKTSIRIYAPTADSVRIHLYKEGIGDNFLKTVALSKDMGGTWKIDLNGDKAGLFYTVQTCMNGIWSNEVTDPYAKAVGVNGDRAQILDLTSTNPQGWDKDVSPTYTNAHAMQDAILYELHVPDASIHASSGIEHKGKFLGLSEMNTNNAHGQSTG